MQGRLLVVAALCVVLVLAAGTLRGQAQLPLAPGAARGLTVTPVFEGWYENADGTYSISFGYFNRNREEILEIPLGPDNFIEPAELDGMQPTRFHPRQHWGVFAVKVPADFGDQKVYWTLRIRGHSYSIPGHLKTDWKIDALAGEAAAGNTPPIIKFEPSSHGGAGPAGITSRRMSTAVDTPLSIRVWASDDGRGSPSVSRAGRDGVPVSLTWFKHQGPGEVTFSEPTAEIPVTGGDATTIATFSAPGDYILRVRANDASGVAGAGHSQCCWTNGFVRVTVTE